MKAGLGVEKCGGELGGDLRGSRLIFACDEIVRLPERAARTPKGPRGESASANAAFRAESTVGAVVPTILNSTQYSTASDSQVQAELGTDTAGGGRRAIHDPRNSGVEK